MKIAHLTSAHPRTDLRIFAKQCKSLAHHGHHVTLIVADGLGDAHHDGVDIRDVGRMSGRVKRLAMSARQICKAALKLRPEICHLHDPELLLYARRLRKSGIRVIYDAHEDLPSQIAAKPYLPHWCKPGITALSRAFLNHQFARLDAVVTATEHIATTVPSAQKQVAVIRNYPFRPPVAPVRRTRLGSADGHRIIYAGGICHLRGVRDLVDAMALIDADVRLDLFGKASPPGFLETLQASPGWDKVTYHGHVPHETVIKAMAQATCGIVVLHPTQAYQNALPVKMFEYMAAGIPVIASNFTLWSTIVSETGCGRCVPPENPPKLAQEIEWLVAHTEQANDMGIMGHRAVRSWLNWEAEQDTLIALYNQISITANLQGTKV